MAGFGHVMKIFIGVGFLRMGFLGYIVCLYVVACDNAYSLLIIMLMLLSFNLKNWYQSHGLAWLCSLVFLCWIKLWGACSGVTDTLAVIFGSMWNLSVGKFGFLWMLKAQGIPLMLKEGMLHQVWNEPLGRYEGGRCTRSLAWCGSERLSLQLREKCEMV